MTVVLSTKPCLRRQYRYQCHFCGTEFYYDEPGRLIYVDYCPLLVCKDCKRLEQESEATIIEIQNILRQEELI